MINPPASVPSGRLRLRISVYPVLTRQSDERNHVTCVDAHASCGPHDGEPRYPCKYEGFYRSVGERRYDGHYQRRVKSDGGLGFVAHLALGCCGRVRGGKGDWWLQKDYE